MPTILISGGTGLLGQAITRKLIDQDHQIIILTRSLKQKASTSRIQYSEWDVKNQIMDGSVVTKADYIIHLAGTSIAEKRWTEKRKNEIAESRIMSSALLVKALKENANNVKAVICASAIGWYGEDPEIPNPEPFNENDEADENFFGQTCLKWEQSIEPVTQLGKRLVKVRTGIVLSNNGGALKEFKKPLRFGIAAILGGGKQIMSWIHIDDIIRIYIYAMKNEAMNGAYNAVAPETVTNKKFTLQLAKMKRGSFFIPIHIPSFILKIVLGEMSIEILKSITVKCDKVRSAGFTFQYPSVHSALTQLKATDL